jgi:hypothetical protein
MDYGKQGAGLFGGEGTGLVTAGADAFYALFFTDVLLSNWILSRLLWRE